MKIKEDIVEKDKHIQSLKINGERCLLIKRIEIKK
jgi:hypothetical protein